MDIDFQDKYSNFKPSPITLGRQSKEISRANVVDMMSVDRLCSKNIIEPYFAYNALCYTKKNVSKHDTFHHMAPNGFLAKSPVDNKKNTPLCASLIAPIGIDIDGPSLFEVNRWLKYQKQYEVGPVVRFAEPTEIEKQQGKLLEKIMSALTITENDLIRVQMIGPYLLLTIDDSEGYYPTLLADPDPSSLGIYSMDLKRN